MSSSKERAEGTEAGSVSQDGSFRGRHSLARSPSLRSSSQKRSKKTERRERMDRDEQLEEMAVVMDESRDVIEDSQELNFEEWETKEKLVEESTNKIRIALERINTATTRESGVGSSAKLSFNKAEQGIVRRAIDEIRDQLMEISQIGNRAMLENVKLRTQIIKMRGEKKERKTGEEMEYREELGTVIKSIVREEMEEIRKEIKRDIMTMRKEQEEKRDRKGEQSTNRGEWMNKNEGIEVQEKTYAGVVGTGRRSVIEQVREMERVEMEEESRWVTPKRKTRFTAIVRKKEGSEESTETMKIIKDTLRGKDIGGGLSNIIQKNKDLVIVECKSAQQLDKVEKELRGKEEVSVRKEGGRRPKFVITGVWGGYKDEELLEMLIKENEELVRKFGEARVKNNVKIVAKKKCRDREKENIIVETEVEIFKYIVKNGKINIDLINNWVEEYVEVAMCYNCCGFNHIAKNCKAEKKCYICAGSHEGNRCESEEVKCINCVKTGKEYIEHRARDMNCPCFQGMMQRVRNTTDYGV